MASFWPHKILCTLRSKAQSTTDSPVHSEHMPPSSAQEEYSHCNWPLWQLLPPLTFQRWARGGGEVSAFSGDIIMLQNTSCSHHQNESLDLSDPPKLLASFKITPTGSTYSLLWWVLQRHLEDFPSLLPFAFAGWELVCFLKLFV